MTSVGMCPPLSGAVPPGRPRLVFPSSQVMMMIPFAANHGEAITGPRLFCSHVSPAVISACDPYLSCGHGEPVSPSACMSLHVFGVTHTKSGGLAESRVDTMLE